MTVWRNDFLGAGYQAHDLKLGSDSEGEVIATLVRAPAPNLSHGFGSMFRRKPIAANTDVLYVHGWSDYFFQTHLATFWHNEGAQFYALDLRKYGRSLRAGHTPGYIEDLTTYFDDIDAAIAAMGPRRGRKLVLMGHSMGGLVLSLWAAKHPKRYDALVLNSPWLEYQLSGTARTAIKPAVSVSARIDPKRTMPNIDFGFYTRTVSSEFDGEWDVNLEWRSKRGFAVRTGWLKAVLAGHTKVAAGLNLTAPSLVMLSTRSILSPRWNPEMARADVAIDVEIVARRSVNLGTDVTIRRIPNAMHDIFLSEKPVRTEAFDALRTWLRGNL